MSAEEENLPAVSRAASEPGIDVNHEAENTYTMESSGAMYRRMPGSPDARRIDSDAQHTAPLERRSEYEIIAPTLSGTVTAPTYFSEPTAISHIQTTTPSTTSSTNVGGIAGAAVGAIGGLALVGIGGWYWIRRRRRKQDFLEFADRPPDGYWQKELDSMPRVPRDLKLTETGGVKGKVELEEREVVMRAELDSQHGRFGGPAELHGHTKPLPELPGSVAVPVELEAIRR